MTVMPSTAIQAMDHTMTRLRIVVDAPFEAFRSRFELAVPPVDIARITGLVQKRATWEEMKSAVAANAPHAFMIYAAVDVKPLMVLAGHERRFVEYLMGNHVIAERMFRHDPAALLYAPLRVALYEDDGRTVFAIDQPSTVFAGFGDPAVAEVGLELDRELDALMVHLGVGPVTKR
ncbi:DUF302 domain-containing protein [Streptomyces sp. AK02-01A]|uniref:DUF302 domain-containing protein n=1 Tax=Streptomyces sp. AK02-01A TaxID=3028648 RepID=UPI0029A651F7|nr:DUF302 domain-containing protein [Streptomyces sp. AK02-01A]MDX3852146.1 DUF302 domain-containing protein [Streptomyces sp. AK02-01A]